MFEMSLLSLNNILSRQACTFKDSAKVLEDTFKEEKQMVLEKENIYFHKHGSRLTEGMEAHQQLGYT